MTAEEIIADERYHTCGRCEWEEIPFLCHRCKWGEDTRKDLWEPTEYRQLAEWLRELKALRENEDVKDILKDCDTCIYLKLDFDDYPCDRCIHRYINQYVYDDKREVNADEN